MDNSPCFQCNLYVANRFRKFQDGSYKEQFCLDCNPSNQYFVQNPMKQQQCQLSDVVCYDVKYGASNCIPNKTTTLTYDIQGNLILKPGVYY